MRSARSRLAVPALLLAPAVLLLFAPARGTDASVGSAEVGTDGVGGVAVGRAGVKGVAIDSTRSADVRRAAPDFSRPTLEGETYTLSKHEGHVVVVNFWATWCPPCREEIPEFVELQDEFGERGLRFVGVALDEGGAAQVRPYVRRFGVDYPIVPDPEGELAEAFGGIPAVPTSFVLDRAGRIAFVVPGRLRPDLLRPALENLLAE